MEEHSNKENVEVKSEAHKTEAHKVEEKPVTQHKHAHKHGVVRHRKSKVDVWKVVSVVLAILLAISLIYNFTGGSGDGDADSDVVTGDVIKLTVINDKRCAQCTQIEGQVLNSLNQMMDNLEVETLDYEDAKDLYDAESIKALPAFLFSDNVKDDSVFSDIQQFTETTANYVKLNVGSSFDPNAEICDNGKDDNGDGKIDCDDSTCASDWTCAMEKTETPAVELFVMSHRPYGTQMEKGIIPVVELLGDKIDFQLKFVNYAMHGEKEVIEQGMQYCIEQEYGTDKLVEYLKCFLEEGDSEGCVEETEISQDDLDSCFEEADEEFKLMYNLNNKEGNFPAFDLHDDDNVKYGVRGSPTLIVNGVKPESGRDSASILTAVCAAFDERPEECDETLSSASPSPGFGYGTASSGGSAATCG